MALFDLLLQAATKLDLFLHFSVKLPGEFLFLHDVVCLVFSIASK